MRHNVTRVAFGLIGSIVAVATNVAIAMGQLSMGRHSIFTVFVVLAVAGSATTLAQNGSATGTLNVNGKTSTMKYAYAYSEPLDAKGEVNIVMIMSDQELPKAVLKNVDQLHELSDKGKFEGVRIVIHDDQRVMSAAPFSKALTGYVSTALYAEWSAKDFTPDGIDARVRTPNGGADAFGQKWSYDVTFKVPKAEIGK